MPKQMKYGGIHRNQRGPIRQEIRRAYLAETVGGPRYGPGKAVRRMARKYGVPLRVILDIWNNREKD